MLTGLIDATVLYGVICALRPARVVELGSGQSTLVAAPAARSNTTDGSPLAVEAYDPYPGVVSHGRAGLTRLHRVAAQEVGCDVFESPQAGDVLIVDTAHTVKLGGDANHIVLETLPRLAPGVIETAQAHPPGAFWIRRV